MVKKNVLLIVNPVSGGVEKSDIVETTTDFVNALGMNLVLYETSGKKDILHIQDLFSLWYAEHCQRDRSIWKT